MTMRTHFMNKAAHAALAAAAGLAVFAPAQALAQDTELGEVVVTAQKRSENLNDVPVSVTAISAEKLDVIRSSGGDIRVLSARIPNVTLESSYARIFPRPYIRGLGNTDFDFNASQPVSFVYDEVVMENPVLKSFPLFDIDQVEALRGPQGTLFGRNTPAGVLKFDSAKPTQTFGGYAQASYATYGTANVQGAVSGPIIDGVLAGRLSGIWMHRDDWIDNGFTGKNDVTGGYDQTAVRGQLLYTPTEAFSALLNVHYTKLDGSPQIFRANIIQQGTNDFVPGFDREKIYQDAEPRTGQTMEGSGANVKLTYDFGENGPTLTSITAYEHVTAYSRGDVDGGFGAAYAPPSGPGLIPFTGESADGVPYHAQWSQEVRLAGDYAGVNYTVGAFYFFEDLKIDSINFDTLADGARNGYAYQHQKTKAWALFANADYKLTDQLTVGGGIRYSNDKKEFIAQQTLSPIGLPQTPILAADPESDDVSFNLSATYALNEDVNLYARIAKGYRAPSIQGRLLFGSTISVADTETLMSYEAGIKGDLFDRRARVDASVYYYKVDDMQLTAVGGGANFNRLVNAEHAEGYGFEFNGEANPIQHLLLTAGLSYSYTEIQDPNLAIQPCGAPCTVLDPAGAPGTVLVDGNSLPNAPRWIANITARYAIPFGDGEFYAYTDWAYRSKINFFLYRSVEFSDDRLLEGGLRLGYATADGKWDAAVFARNITDDESLEGGIDFINLTGFVNDPRTIGVELKTRF